ncbi:MAG TPA: glycosyltransferase family A protein [Bryobacteraceae bacterium]|nr:glycosyltransferase family A protein [Bryobacteraceae bacterium]
MLSHSVSVIIPVRNGELYLAEAIDSVLKQTYPPHEVIVVDNGSTDGSRRAAERFARLVRVIDEPVPSIARARNAGVQAASGDLIAFLDADDLWDPPKLARQIDVLEQQAEVDLVFTWMRDFISPELTEAQRVGLAGRGAYEGWHASTMLCRTSALHAAGPMPEIPLGEFIAWYGVAQSAGLHSHMISDVLAKRRMHLQNTTRGLEDRNGYLQAAKLVLDSKRARGRAPGD